MKLFTIFFSGLCCLLQAQPVQIGVKGGVTLTNQVPYGVDDSKPYTVGPTVEFQLPANFAVETGFLYKRIGTSHRYTLIGSGTGMVNVGETVYSGSSRGHSFEIPVIGKYYVRRPAAWTPFLGVGFAMRRTNQSVESVVTGPADGPTAPGSYRLDYWSPWGVGAVGSAGVQFRAGRVKFAPEFRYTRWSRESQAISRNRNQVEFLFGVSF